MHRIIDTWWSDELLNQNKLLHPSCSVTMETITSCSSPCNDESLSQCWKVATTFQMIIERGSPLKERSNAEEQMHVFVLWWWVAQPVPPPSMRLNSVADKSSRIKDERRMISTCPKRLEDVLFSLRLVCVGIFLINAITAWIHPFFFGFWAN